MWNVTRNDCRIIDIECDNVHSKSPFCIFDDKITRNIISDRHHPCRH